MKEIIVSSGVLGLTGFIFAAVLAFLSKKLYVEDDPRVASLMAVLPGLNCSACGFSGCRGYAEAVVKECKLFSGCLPGGSEVNNKISQLLGVVGCVSKKSQVVACRCGALGKDKKISSKYYGPATCKASHISGGAIDCAWGCLAFGDCVSVCPVGALLLKKGKIYVDINKCTGCGQCVKACPRKLFELVPFALAEQTCYVACSNHDKAAGVRAVCGRGCIACGLCTKVPESPYYLKDNLSYVDYTKAKDIKSLLEGKNKCPTKCIFELHV